MNKIPIFVIALLCGLIYPHYRAFWDAPLVDTYRDTRHIVRHPGVADCTTGHGNEQIEEMIREAVEFYYPMDYKLDSCWVIAQFAVESGLNPDAVSPAGAVQVAQVMPTTFRDMAAKYDLPGDIYDTRSNIQAGVAYMSYCLEFWIWDRTQMERRRLGWACYNAGAGNIRKAQIKALGARNWAHIKIYLPEVTGRHAQETINYVDRIEVMYDRITL